MNWKATLRQAHRWLSMAFTLAIVLVVVLASIQEEPADWVYYLPLPPLSVLLLTGLYLFAQPYTTTRRRARRVAHGG